MMADGSTVELQMSFAGREVDRFGNRPLIELLYHMQSRLSREGFPVSRQRFSCRRDPLSQDRYVISATIKPLIKWRRSARLAEAG